MLILHFIYTDTVSQKFPDEIGKVMEVVKAAHFFESKGLSLRCEEKLIENLLREKVQCVDLGVEMFCFVDRYGMEILREISLASDNIGKIIASGIQTNLDSELWHEIGFNCEKRAKVDKVHPAL